jgi:hypothetical protein
MTLDANGRLLVGGTSAVYASNNGAIEAQSANGALLNAGRFAANAGGPSLTLFKSRNATVGGNTIVVNGDTLGEISFVGANGTGYDVAATIRASVDGTPGASADMPGRLTFFTSADGSATPTERMRLDASGNLGLGVTPSAWGSIFKVLQVGAGASYVGGRTDSVAGRQVWLGTNSYYNGTNWIYGVSQPAAQYYQNDGSHIWNTAVSGTAGNTISFTQAMTLDASGNLLVGTTTNNASGGVIQVSNGITFPATQSASTDANTLDDYEEGAWTPVLTFVTPGDVSVTYSTQVGRYTKIGNQVTVVCAITTSAFTHTTASGNLNITGLPFAAANITGYLVNGTCSAAGWTKTCEWVTPQIGSNTSDIYFQASTSGSSLTNVTTADVPTATQQIWRVTLTYFV